MDPITLQAIDRYDSLWRQANAVYEVWAKKHGLSYHELLTAMSLWEAPCTQREICKKWQLAKQTVYAVSQNFLRRGWIRFERSEIDRRHKTICLTDLGRESLGPIIQALREHEYRVWERLGERRGADLIENMEFYIRLFEERNT